MAEEEEKEEKENQKYGWFVVKYAWGSLKWGFIDLQTYLTTNHLTLPDSFLT